MSKRKLDAILKDYYQDGINEDQRLIKDKVHQIEFLTTTKYIEKYLRKNDTILEIGAGTGAYSIYYANKGYNVEAVELVEKNVELMNKKITPNMKINTHVGNALDLSLYKDNTFDITLVLGPLYHLFQENEEQKAIEEAIRVTKPKGKIFLAFVLTDLSILTWGFQNKNIYEIYGLDKQITLDFTDNKKEDFIFNTKNIDEIKNLLKDFSIKILSYVATDGIAKIMKDTVNNMTDEEYALFLKYHYKTCERKDLIGYSGHILVIAEKNDNEI